jgi:hypothetical protein
MINIFFFVLSIYYIFIIIHKSMVITIQNINYNIIYVSQKMQLSNFINICQIDISVNITRLLNIVKKHFQ